MMRIKNTILKIFIFVLIVSTLMLFSSCKNTENDDVSLGIDKGTINILLYQTDNLTVNYNGTSELIWTVSDEDIVSVDKGLITAKAVGETMVTVTAGNLSDSCIVTVLPLVEEEFEVVINDSNISIYNGDTYNVNSELHYNELAFSGVTYEYLSTDDLIASVNSNGLISAKKVGVASIIVKATYYDFVFHSAISVNVVSPYAISLSTDEIVLFAKGEDSQTKAIIEATAKNRGQNVDGVNFSYSAVDALQDVVNISSEGEIIAKNAGSTFIKVSANIEGEQCESTVLINVLPVTNNLNNDNVFIDLLEGAFQMDYSNLGVVGEITGAYVFDDGVNTEVEVTNDGLIFNNIDAGEKALVLQTRNENYVVSVDFWTAVIDDVDELKCLYNATTGKYRLNNDIDMSSIDWEYQNLYNVFTGVFDGNNKSIKGLAITGKHGLFGNVGNGAVIKNLTINVDMTEKSSYTGTLFSSVNDGATVTIDNVNIMAYDSGELNGGLAGLVGSKAKLNIVNSSIIYYCVYGGSDSGALTARCTGNVLVDNVRIYSSIQPCGTKSVEGNSIKTAESLNKNIANSNSIIRPVELEKLNVNLDSTVASTNPNGDVAKGIYLLNLPSNIQIHGNVNEYYLFNQKMQVKEFDQNKGYTIEKSDINSIVGRTVELYFIDDANNVYYFSHKLFSELYIFQNNVEELTKVTDGKVLIKEDIDLGNYSYWTSDISFTGQIDGEGHIIKNLKVRGDKVDGKNSFGLFYKFGGEIKNIIFIDANIGHNSGVLGYQLSSASSNVVIENVFVCQITGAAGASSFTGGFISKINNPLATINLKNVVYSALETSNSNGEFGFVSGFGTALVNLENCYFIGGQNKAVGDRADYPTKVEGEYKYFAQDIDFFKEYSKEQSSITLNTLLEKGVKNGIKIIAISNKNVDELITAITGYYFLTEDITLPSTYNDGAGRFKGTLDGEGHTIIVVNKTGIFYGVEDCIIKNLTVVMKNGVDEQRGAFGYQSRSTVSLENVFIQTKGALKGGAVVGVVYNGTLKLNNIVITTGDTADDLGAGALADFGNQDQKSKITATNIYIISNFGLTGNLDANYSRAITVNGAKIDSNEDRFATLEGIKMYKQATSFGDFYKTGYDNLTEFLQEQCEKYLQVVKDVA